MKKTNLLIALFCCHSSFAQNLLVEDLKPNSYRIGTRLQGVMEHNDKSMQESNRVDQDFFLRRARLQVGFDWKNGWSQYMDIRNDRVNQGDKGEGDFNLGDAFISKKLSTGEFNHKFKFFRAKVDISRTQTVSSARILYLNRAKSSDFAANYISHNRRANNLQWNGDYKEKVEWQLVVGDGVQSASFTDALGKKADGVGDKKFIYGTKARVYLLGKKQKKLNETFFATDRLLSVGGGVFTQQDVRFSYGGESHVTDRTLTNLEITAVFGRLSLMGEFFHFSSVAPDFKNSLSQSVASQSFFLQSEYKLNDKWSLYARYEDWNKALSLENFTLENYVLGLNHYYQGNKTKFGFFVDQTRNDQNISSVPRDTSFLLTAMLHFY